METGTLIKILVFGLAAFVVLIFVLSGVHFARAVYMHQLLQQQRAERRMLALNALAEDRGRIALVEIKQKDGFIILQPDGMENLALRVESEDERAYKRLAEQKLAEHEAQKRLDALRHQASRQSHQSSLQHSSSSATPPGQSTSHSRHHQTSANASEAAAPHICASCGMPQTPGSSHVNTPHHASLTANASAPQIASPGGTEGGSSMVLSSIGMGPPPNSGGLESTHRDSGQGSPDVAITPTVREHSLTSVQTAWRGDENMTSPPNGDIESHGRSVRSRSLQFLKSAKRWLMSTDSYFD